MPSEAPAFPFSDRGQQLRAARLGMWIFLATEIMLFGGLFAAYGCFRPLHEAGFAAAGARADLPLGAANTAILLVSSLTMALAVLAAEEGRGRRLAGLLRLTAGLGAAFLALKGVEYAGHVREHLFPGGGFAPPAGADPRGAELFFTLYFLMTGLHALHMIAGIAVLAALSFLAGRGRFTPASHAPVLLAGLYWHLIDVVWIFLFPLFYLAGRR